MITNEDFSEFLFLFPVYQAGEDEPAGLRCKGERDDLLVDMGNFVCADENPVTAVSRVAPYAIHAHAKDMILSMTKEGDASFLTRGGRYCRGCVIGEGDVPVQQCLRILKAAGYDGYVSIEYEGEEDCIAGIGRGLQNLKRFLHELSV